MSIPVEVQETVNESWGNVLSVHFDMDETMRDFFDDNPDGTSLQFFEDWNSSSGNSPGSSDEAVQEDAFIFLTHKGYSEEDADKLSEPDGEYTNYFREAYRNAAKNTDETSWERETQKWR